jgi:hypothetical protein
MSAPAAADTFDRFVAVEEELLERLQNRVGQDRKMLSEMRRAG